MVIVEMLTQPRRDDVGRDYGKGLSQSDKRTRNALDATHVFETVANLLMEALVKV